MTTVTLKDGNGNPFTVPTEATGTLHSVPEVAGAAVSATNPMPTVVNGNSAAPSVATPTLTASSAYVSGNVLGGLMSFANFNRGAGLSAYLQNLLCTSAGGQTVPIDVFLFNANPTNSTFTDKSAIAINAADVGKIVGVVQLTNFISGGTPTAALASNLGLNINLAATTLYAVAVARGTPTFASTSDLSFRIAGPQD